MIENKAGNGARSVRTMPLKCLLVFVMLFAVPATAAAVDGFGSAPESLALQAELFTFTPKLLSHEGVVPALDEQLERTTPDQFVEMIVVLDTQVDLRRLDQSLTEAGHIKMTHRVNIVTHVLQNHAAQTQSDLLAFLREEESQGRASGIISHAIMNAVSVTGSSDFAIELARRADVARVEPNHEIYLAGSFEPPNLDGATVPSPARTNWGINAINADDVWNMGYTGAGVLIANIDTGVRYTHEQLIDSWREENGWFDPYWGREVPDDSGGHGTGTMGFLTASNDKSGEVVSMAPDTTWIAARGLTRSGGDFGAILQCGDWLLTTGRPHIISNSWIGGNAGCDTFYEDVIWAWRAAGIFSCFGAGNWEYDASPADNEPGFAVGGTESDGDAMSGTGKGPSGCTGDIFPEVAAPATSTWTTAYNNDQAYDWFGGTSAATPHVGGAAALLLDYNPALSVAEIEQAFLNTGEDLGDPGPDNTFGFGEIDVLAALGEVPTPSPARIVAALGSGMKPTVRTYDHVGNYDGTEVQPYKEQFLGGVYTAAGNFSSAISGDTFTLVTGPGRGGGPHVRCFVSDGSPLPVSFFAYKSSFRGGVRVASGNLNGAGLDEIITGAGPGGAPHVRGFGSGGRPNGTSFLAFESGFRGGVYVASADLNGDGIDEILASSGSGRQSQVRAFNSDGTTYGLEIAPFDPTFDGGSTVAGADLDDDGIDEIIVGSGPGQPPYVRIYDALGNVLGTFLAYRQTFRGGVFVAAGDINDQPGDEIITGTDQGGGAHVRAFHPDGAPAGASFIVEPGFKNGVRVAVRDN